MILYNDGTKQIITPIKSIKVQNEWAGKISLFGNTFYRNTSKLKNKALDSLLSLSNSPNIKYNYTKGLNENKRGSIFLHSSLPILALSGISLIFNVISYNQAVNFINVAKTSYTKKEIVDPYFNQLNTANDWIIASSSVGVLALGTSTYGIVLKTKGRRKLNLVLDKLNETNR